MALRSCALLVTFAACLSHIGSQFADVKVIKCNGYEVYCARRFDEVMFPMTHNSFAAREKGYAIAFNHNKWIDHQLEGGIRGFMLDIWIDEDHVSLCHAACSPFKDGPREDRRHLDALLTVAAFLDSHPYDVVTIIYEDHVGDVSRIVEDYNTAGLVESAYVHNSSNTGNPDTEVWPTLQHMIEAKSRLVVMTDVWYDQQIAPWLHFNDDLYWETSYENQEMEDFDCELDRGFRGENKLLVVNHFRYGLFNLPSEEKAEDSNDYAAIVQHALLCNATSDRPQFPNFIVVDFWSTGDILKAVDDINLMRFSGPSTTDDTVKSSTRPFGTSFSRVHIIADLEYFETSFSSMLFCTTLEREILANVLLSCIALRSFTIR
eukprot:gene5695-6883_t